MSKIKEGLGVKWSFTLDSWCAVRRTCRACSAASERLLPCFCSVTAFPSRSSFLEPMLPTARVRQDFHLHNTTHSFFLVCHHPSAFHHVLIRVLCGLRPLNPSPFIHAYSHVQSSLASLRYPAQERKAREFFPLTSFFGLGKHPLSFFSFLMTILKNLWLIEAGPLRTDSNLIYYFTHQQSHVAWRG